MKYGSEISQPPTRPDVIEIDAINAFMKRNPVAEGGRIPFAYAGPVKFENIIKPKIYEGNRFSKKLPKGTFTMRLYMGLDENGNRIEETFTGTKKQLKKIFDKNNKARVKGDLPTMGDSKVYEVRQGKNKGKFAIKMPKENTYSFYETEDLAEKHKTDYLNDPANKVGGDRTKKVTPPDGYVSGKDMLEEAKKKKIYVGENRQASNFADVFGFPKTTKDGQMFYDISKLNNEEAVDAILKSQVKSGSATKEAKEKFPVKTKTELQTPRLEAIEAQGGVKKNDPYAGKRGSGIELGHTGNIYGTELITGDKLAYTPTEVNQLMGEKGNLDDKIRSVSEKIENIKASNKPANVKKDLLEQADTILIRLSSQSQGFKKVTLSGGGTFGGDRLTVDYLGIYPGKTEKEIQKMQKEYLGKKIITEGPNKTSAAEIQKIQDAFFFEKNRKEVMKAAKKIGKKEIKKITENINLDFNKQAEAYITDRTGKVKQPMLPSGFAGAYEMLSDDLKAITNSEGFKKFKASIANPALMTAAKAAKLPTKIFGAADLVLGYLDYSNNRQKGFSKEDATKHMVDAILFGASSFGEKGDIEGVKKIAMQNGMSEEVFNNLVSVNLNQKAMIDRINESKAKFNESMDLIESGISDPATEKMLIQKLKVDTKKFLTNTMKDVVDASRSLNTNLQVQEAGAPININVDTQQQKAFSDLGSASREFVQKRIDASDLEKIANQKDTTKGGIGDAVMSGLKATYTQPKFIYDLINPLSPLPKAKDFFPKDLNYKAQMEQLKKEDPTMYYKMLMSEGVDPRINLNIPVQLEFEQKYPEFGTQLSDSLTQNKSEGGITELRSKYEYKK